MKYFSENTDFINAECEHCKRVLKIKREQVVPTTTGFSLTSPGGIQCFCGTIHTNITGTAQSTSGSSAIVCPHCNSKGTVTTKMVKMKKGISGAKATGTILTGGLSILATGLSRKEKVTEAHYTTCGATWHYS